MTQLYPYQRRGVRLIGVFEDRVLLADEMGLGKTLQALKRVFTTGKFPCVVICPASLKQNWKREIKKHFGLRVEVLSGKKTKPIRCRFGKKQIIIVNYEILGAWLSELLALKPKTVIVDEVQAIKNREAKRSRWTRRLCRRTKNVYLLSGTPLTNRPWELWVCLNILWPKEFPAFWPFAHEYSVCRRTRYGWKFLRGKRLDRLHKKLKRLGMIRRLKRDVLKDLPPKTHIVLPLDIGKKKLDEYRYAESNFVEWLGKQSMSKLRRAKRAIGIAKMIYLRGLIGELKQTIVFDWLDNWMAEDDGKFIMFAHHRKILDTYHERYLKNSVCIHGKTKDRDRWKAIDKFQGQKECRLMFGQIDVMGSGHNLTAADKTGFAELPWTPAQIQQCCDRINRIGQKKDKTFHYYFIVENTIDHDMCEINQTKQATLNAILDGEGKGDKLNIYDQIVKRMKERR